MNAFSIVLVVLALLCIDLGSIELGSSQNLEFKSGVSIQIGVPIDFNMLYQKANEIYEIVENDDTHVVWKFIGTTGDLAFVFADGRIIVGSNVDLAGLAVKDTLDKELNDVIDILNLVYPQVITDNIRRKALDSTIYYASDSGVYHQLKYGFSSNFDFTLMVPNCTIEEARLSVKGSEKSTSLGGISGQYYFIDGQEILNCEMDCTGICMGYPSCTAGSKDITDKISAGSHAISAKEIESTHTLIIEAITSPNPPKNFVMHGPKYTPWINETIWSRNLLELQNILHGS